MEWNPWLKCVILYWGYFVYKGVEGGGRGCESLRIGICHMNDGVSDGIELASHGLLIQHSTSGPPGHVMKFVLHVFKEK